MLTKEELKARYDKFETELDVVGRAISVRRLRPSRQAAVEGMTSDLMGHMSVPTPDGGSIEIGRNAMMMIAASVIEIDGRPIAFPRNRAELDAIFDELDIEGVTAAANALARLAPQPSAGADSPKDAAKN